MSLFEKKSKGEWIKVLTDFSKETEMPAAVYDSQNNLLMTTGERNKICLDIRNDDSARATICGLSQNVLAQMAKKNKKPVTDFCDAGFIKMVIPCFLNNEYLGGLTACGNREPATQIEFLYIAETLEINEEEIEQVPVRSTTLEKMKKIGEKYYDIIND